MHIHLPSKGSSAIYFFPQADVKYKLWLNYRPKHTEEMLLPTNNLHSKRLYLLVACLVTISLKIIGQKNDQPTMYLSRVRKYTEATYCPRVLLQASERKRPGCTSSRVHFRKFRLKFSHLHFLIYDLYRFSDQRVTSEQIIKLHLNVV
jgi:hypothetical protein